MEVIRSDAEVSQEVQAQIRQRTRMGFNIDINIKTIFDIGRWKKEEKSKHLKSLEVT